MLRNINHCFRNVKKLIGIDFGKTLFQVSGSFLGVCSPLIEPQPDFYRGGFQRIRLLKDSNGRFSFGKFHICEDLLLQYFKVIMIEGNS